MSDAERWQVRGNALQIQKSFDAFEASQAFARFRVDLSVDGCGRHRKRNVASIVRQLGHHDATVIDLLAGRIGALIVPGAQSYIVSAIARTI